MNNFIKVLVCNYLTIGTALFLTLSLSLSSCAQSTGNPVAATITAEDLKSSIDQGYTGVILDVRTPKEVANGVLPNAIVIDFQGADFKSELSKLDKNQPYTVYCHAGGRSAKTKELMLEMGFTTVTDYKGGFSEWSQKQYPLVSAKP
jgi:rhodanese-related sulfurtransferase